MYLDRRAASEFFLHFYETLLSWTNFPFYQHIWELPFTPSSCTLGVTNFKLFVSLGRVKGYLMVVICISFVSVVDDIFIYFSVFGFLPVYLTCLLIASSIFYSVVVFKLICQQSLYILGTKPLFVLYVVSTFSQNIVCVFLVVLDTLWNTNF